MPEAKPTTNDPRILVVGGMRRKVGKTSVIEAILRTFPGRHWTAVKISSHLHDRPAGVRLLERGFIGNRAGRLDTPHFRLREDTESNTGTDTGRFMAAGAFRAMLVEADDAHLPDATASLLELLRDTRAGCVICETTRAATLLGARLFLMVVDGSERAKPLAQSVAAFADAMVVCAPFGDAAAMREPARTVAQEDTERRNFGTRPVFRIQRGDDLPADSRSFIESRFWGESRES
jgi:molybdopterin-guanine dinucleotide biosynthesis protein